MTASRVSAHECQRRAVLFLSVVNQPDCRVFAIVVALRIWVFWRKTIADADNCKLAILCDPIEHQVLIVFGLKDPAAAVNV